MKHTAIRLTLSGPIHLGTPRTDYSISDTLIHSDTMYAALTQMWHLLGMMNEVEAPYADFAVSSLFPFAALNNEFHYFFPKPFLPRLSTVEEARKESVVDAKKWKKLQWVDRYYFEQMLATTGFQLPESDAHRLKGKFLVKADESVLQNFSVYWNRITPRTQISRRLAEKEQNLDTRIFYIDRLSFEPGCGFWFLLVYKDDATLRRVTDALDLLQEEGLGTDRALGLGRFTYACDHDFKPIHVERATHYLSLSLYCPETKEAASQSISYELIRRGGWITSEGSQARRKKSLYMFKEGSVFNESDDLCLTNAGSLHTGGKAMIPVEPRQEDDPNDSENACKVWRCGKSVFFPCKL